MANIEKAFSEIVDVVTHLIHTNRTWNQDLSHAEAVAKLAAVKVHLTAGDVAEVAGDAESGDAVKAVEDGVKTIGDVADMVKSNG